MKYLINGGCGFLGSNLAAGVLQRGEELVVFDNLSRLGSVENLAWLRRKGNVTFIHGDIRQFHEVQSTIAREQPDVIFHLAGQVAMTTSLDKPRLDFETNTLGSLNILEAVRLSAPKAKILYSSTNKVYGDLEYVPVEEHPTRYIAPNYPHGFDENTRLEFHSPYGCSKGAADQYMQDYARAYGLQTMVFRHSSMYGSRQYGTFDQGWVSWFCMQGLAQKNNPADQPFTIAGNGKQVRDVLHADDMETLYFQAAKAPAAAFGQAYNIGGSAAHSLSLLELFSLIEENLGVTLRYEKLPPRFSDQKVFIANTNKAEKLLGWKPQKTAAAGVRELLTWLSEEKIPLGKAA